MFQMFIFIDESGLTDAKSEQRYLIVAFAIMNNKAFADELIFSIRDKCQRSGKPIKKKEIKYHDLEPLQKEIAVQTINSRYRNFYICFIDLGKASQSLVTGKHESEIQTKMIHNLLLSFDKEELMQKERLKIIMDKKLSSKFQESIRSELQMHLGTKKGIMVEAANSSKVRGIQVADIIAGAFRARLMKKSELFHVDFTHIYQITISDDGIAHRSTYK